MGKSHITSKNKGLKHFARHHSQCEHAEDEGCNYSHRELAPEKGKPDYREIKGFKAQNHHIIPASCLRRFETWKAYRGYAETIRAVYELTDWCSSRNKNLIALPTRRKAARAAELPLHNLHHNNAGGYNDEVIADLHLKVWMKAKEAKGKPECEQEKANEIAGELAGIESGYRRKLHRRGEHESLSMAQNGQLLSKEDLLAKLKRSQERAADDPVQSVADLG